MDIIIMISTTTEMFTCIEVILYNLLFPYLNFSNQPQLHLYISEAHGSC